MEERTVEAGDARESLLAPLGGCAQAPTQNVMAENPAGCPSTTRPTSWKRSRTRFRWSPLRLWRFALLMLCPRLNGNEAGKLHGRPLEVSLMYRIDESTCRPDGVTEITKATLLSVAPVFPPAKKRRSSFLDRYRFARREGYGVADSVLYAFNPTRRM